MDSWDLKNTAKDQSWEFCDCMKDADAIKERLRSAFQNVARPEHFTNYEHCEECAEHDETLASYTPENIPYKVLGNPGWDPICFALPEAFLYYFPGLVRLALDGQGDEVYLDQFLLHVISNRFLEHFNKEQRLVTLEVLRFIREQKSEEIDWIMLRDVDQAISLWEALIENA